MSPSTNLRLGAVLAPLAAALPMAWIWGFSVDDALISARVAHHLAVGHGYRFNLGGPIVDAVTPLGFAHLLSLFARSGPLAGFVAAKWLGAVAWVSSAIFLGRELGRKGRRGLWVGLFALVLTTPLAAWAVSGMETGIVLALATLGLGHGNRARVALGLAAGFRPEAAPWALVLSLGGALLESRDRSPRALLLRGLPALGLALGPLLLVGTIRFVVFGAAYPLAALAKPSDLHSGMRYALGAWALSGPPLLALTVFGYRKLSPHSRLIAASALVHAFAISVAGGDWMPLYRLFVPVLPGLILVGAELSSVSSGIVTGLRVLLFSMATLLVGFGLGPSARKVGMQRASLIQGARPLLAGAKSVATLDVGWVGAATAADIVDLAGVTDLQIARLSGGHTSKRLPEGLFETRGVDAVVLLASAPRLEQWPELSWARDVERRAASLAGVEKLSPVGLLPLSSTTQAYVVLR